MLNDGLSWNSDWILHMMKMTTGLTSQPNPALCKEEQDGQQPTWEGVSEKRDKVAKWFRWSWRTKRGEIGMFWNSSTDLGEKMTR